MHRSDLRLRYLKYSMTISAVLLYSLNGWRYQVQYYISMQFLTLSGWRHALQIRDYMGHLVTCILPTCSLLPPPTTNYDDESWIYSSTEAIYRSPLPNSHLTHSFCPHLERLCFGTRRAFGGLERNLDALSGALSNPITARIRYDTLWCVVLLGNLTLGCDVSFFILS